MVSPGEISLLCRLCLVKDQVNVPIFGEQGDIRQIFLKISSCLPVTVSKEDQLPKNICEGCSDKLDLLFAFWNSSRDAEKTLVSWLKQASVDNANETINAIAKQISAKPVAEVKQETDDGQNIKIQQSSEEGKNDESEEAPPPPKRARRTAAVKAQISISQEDESEEEEDDVDAVEPLTKVEDESDMSDNDGADNQPLSSFVDMPGTSADDQEQAGPSGVGKDGGADAPFFNNSFLLEDPSSLDALEQYQCGICSAIFASEDDFNKEHIDIFFKTLTCCVCQRIFDSLDDLYDHQEGHKDDSSAKMDNLLFLETEEGQEIFQIPEDDMVYILNESSGKKALELDQTISLDHGYVCKKVETVHKKSIPRPRPSSLTAKRSDPNFSATEYVVIEPNEKLDFVHYKCQHCEQLFINKAAFYRHVEKGKCYINSCDVCNERFVQNGDFFAHYVAEHRDRAICNFCFRTFMYEKNVREHMLRHLDQFRHVCDKCHKGFYTVREYRNHYKNRHMGIRHQCDLCERNFADEYYFKKHRETHRESSESVVRLLTLSNV